MTEQQQDLNTANPEQLRDRAESYQEKLLNQYSELIANNTLEASQQALNDQLCYYEALGVKKGFQQFKEHATNLMQEKLEGLNQRNSRKILELRASTPDVAVWMMSQRWKLLVWSPALIKRCSPMALSLPVVMRRNCRKIYRNH
jgi:hypothetical protein